MDSLLQLAERCEAAEASGQRAMLNEAAERVWGVFVHAGVEPDLWVARWNRFNRMLDAEAYESAAMMLVPEGLWWSCGDIDGPRANVWGWQGQVKLLQDAQAATPALALCAADLRARHSQGVSDNG